MLKKIFRAIAFLLLAFVVYLFYQALISSGHVHSERVALNLLPTKSDTSLQKIAFGSCNRQDEPQFYWSVISRQQPDQWIWLGDNIYGDTDDLQLLQRKYDQQKQAPEYAAFIQRTKVFGIYDDHDYGSNDGGKEWRHKAAAKKKMLEFLDVPENNPAYQREGGYQTYLLGEANRQVRIILLDTRYFRDELIRNQLNAGQRYHYNESGDILGEAQWHWLERTLEDNTAAVTLLVSSIQILPDEHGYEKWANFPKARQRLLRLLYRAENPNLFLLSGDRHLAEVSRAFLREAGQRIQSTPEWPGVAVTEITASGLTHAFEAADEANPYRQSPLIGKKNYGLLTINWATSTPALLFQLLSPEDNEEFYRMSYDTSGQLFTGTETNPSFSKDNMIESLKPCPNSPNCVSTQTGQEKKKKAPLAFKGDLAQTKAAIVSLIGELPRTKLVKESDNYLHFTFTTFPIPFVDDVEFLFDEATNEVHFRSASRVGHSDLGVNGRRMDKIARRWTEQ